jgi:hypothetical protein
MNAKMTAADIAKALKGRWVGSSGSCRCPAHDDKNPPLSVSEGDGGQILVKCHAGCDQQTVIAALIGRGLWPMPEPEPRRLTCQWCGSKFMPRKTGGSDQVFCSKRCREFLHSAARQWAVRAFRQGDLTPRSVTGT